MFCLADILNRWRSKQSGSSRSWAGEFFRMRCFLTSSFLCQSWSLKVCCIFFQRRMNVLCCSRFQFAVTCPPPPPTLSQTANKLTVFVLSDFSPKATYWEWKAEGTDAGKLGRVSNDGDTDSFSVSSLNTHTHTKKKKGKDRHQTNTKFSRKRTADIFAGTQKGYSRRKWC